MMRFFRDLWRARQRAVDLKILWPALLRSAPDRKDAVVAFQWHATQDTAWKGFTPDDVARVLDRTPTPKMEDG